MVTSYTQLVKNRGKKKQGKEKTGEKKGTYILKEGTFSFYHHLIHS